MRKIFVICFVLALNLALFADKVVGSGNSYSEFPYIIFVGQIIEVTPFSVVFENTVYDTNTTTEKIGELIALFDKDNDFRSHGMANALRAASVKDGKMRLSFYVDNIAKIFSDDAATYVRYVPLFHLFENNVKSMMLADEQIESIKKISGDYFLNLPMVKDLMQKSWLAAVFQINPTDDKLTYKSARFFNNLDELNQSDWAHSYRIPDIVKAGLTVSMTKAIYVGHESEEPDSSDSGSGSSKGNRNGNKVYKSRPAPVGQEK